MATAGELFVIHRLHYTAKAAACELGSNPITTFYFSGITDDRGGI
jgi:hypothetical protein